MLYLRPEFRSSKSVRRSVSIAACAFFTASAVSLCQAVPREQISAAPQVKLRFIDTISSANAKVGQGLLLEVIDPVSIDGKALIAAGAHAHATVTQVRHRGRNRREGKLVLATQTVTETDGSEAALKSAVLQKGTGKGELIFGPCTFPFPADPARLFRKGVDVVIPKGTEFIATIKTDQSH